MKEIKIKRRSLTILTILLIVLSLFFAFGWINSEVSYKYEVQDSIYSGDTLNEHQKDILYYIVSSKVELICCVMLLVIVLFIQAVEPSFKGRILYYDKSSNNA